MDGDGWQMARGGVSAPATAEGHDAGSRHLEELPRLLARLSPQGPKKKVKKGYASRREVGRHVSTARVLRGDEKT
jgi:hypothetical protein